MSLSKTSPMLLIVDQEESPTLFNLVQLKNAALHCQQVNTAADCLKNILQRNVTLAVIDENLPDLSGLKLVTLVKKMKPDLEIIFTTSCHEPQKEKDARLAGIIYYAVKPIDWTVLSQIVERTLAKQNKKLSFSHTH